jgi:hypothetical protein
MRTRFPLVGDGWALTANIAIILKFRGVWEDLP